MTDKHDDLRTDFEAHMRKLNPCARLHRQREALGGHYRTTTVQRAWEQWQVASSAGQRAAAVRAAEVCMKQAKEPECPERAAYCADAILREFGIDKEQSNG